MCGKKSFVFGLLTAIVVFSSASKGGSYIYTMGDEEYNIIKDFFNGNFNVPVADRARLRKNAYVNFWTLRKGLSIDLEGNLLYEEKRVVNKTDVKRIATKISSKTNLEDVVNLEQE